jgi:hypothetical protein
LEVEKEAVLRENRRTVGLIEEVKEAHEKVEIVWRDEI